MTRTALLVVLASTAPALAHDTWVETNTNVVRCGDAVHVDLKLGNHGNDHRDFKLASKVDLEPCTLVVHAPGRRSFDLKPGLVDTGYAPKEGYWTAKFAAADAGLYAVVHTRDGVANHGTPTRSVKSGKTFFVVSRSLDKVPVDNPGFDRRFGHALELVPQANPVTPMGPGQEIAVQLLFKGQPLKDHVVSFVPRSGTLQSGFDPTYERRTDAQGVASFEPKSGDVYLVVAHHHTDEAGDDYVGTAFSATLTVFVPEVCPCCGE
jgi:uncharacterized GH25 family protein